MKFKLKLEKEFEIDTDKDWGGDLDGLFEQLKNCGLAEGETASKSDIEEAIREMLAEGIETVVDLDLDETNFTITVEEGTTIDIPLEG
jgi:hypothetical protein